VALKNTALVAVNPNMDANVGPSEHRAILSSSNKEKGDRLYCPLCSEAGKPVEMVTIKKDSPQFSFYQDKFGYQYHFFAECPKCGAKLLAYARG